MKKRILSLFLTVLLVVGLLPVGAFSASAATSISFNGLPVLDITINKDLTYIHELKTNAATDGQVTLYDATGKQKVSMRLEQFKGRGNASWAMAGDKRSYNLKCITPVELIPGAGKGKNWVLVANNVIFSTVDRTGLANMASQTLYQQMGGASALSFQPVDLWINEDYRGTYLLLEKVEIQKERVNITKADMVQDENFDHVRTVNADAKDITAGEQALLDMGIQHFRYAPGSKVKTDGGFILEADNRYLKNNHDYADKGAGSFFVTKYGAQIVIKEPEFVTLDQLTKVATYVQEFEDSLYNRTGYNSKGKYYTSYVDLSSLAKRVLLDSATGQLDVFKTSCYFYIDGDANGLKGKLIAGPAWDYDNLDLEAKELYSVADKTWPNGARNWFAQLLTKGGFVDLLYDMNKDVLVPLLNTMANETLSTFRDQQMASQKLSDLRWKSKYDLEIGNDFPTLSTKFIRRFQNRVNLWNTAVWGQEHLMGVTLAVKGGTITATVNGTAKSYSWCKVNENDPADYVTVQNGGSTYTPTEKGAYFVKVQGEPLGSGHRYGGGSNEIAGTTMYSSVLHVGCIHSLKATPAVPANCWESGTAAYWSCTQCGSLFADAAGQIPITAPKITAPTGKHTWDAGTVTLEAACDDTGVLTYNCQNCTATKLKILPKDPSAPPRKTAVKTEDDKVIIGDASQGTVIKPGSASSSDTGQNADGSVILRPGVSLEDVMDPVTSSTPTTKTTRASAVGGDNEASGTGEDNSAKSDVSGDTPQGSGSTVVTRPNTDTPADGDASEKQGLGWLEIGILAAAVAACLGILIPLTIISIRSKRKTSETDEVPVEPADPPADTE